MIESISSFGAKTSLAAPVLPFPLQPLARLSWNYWWSWAPDGESCFRDLDPVTWEACEHNPRLLLTRISEYRLAEMATDPVYLERVAKLANAFDRYLAEEKSWSNAAADTTITREHPVAYFCAEYGVHNSLPVYSGGLGVLAGDHLKSASDLSLPLVAVGLLYRKGYFRQRLSLEGWQEENYVDTEPSELPLNLVEEQSGTPLQVEVLIRDRRVRAQVWRADVGRVALYLLDTNIPENAETDRWVTGHLYGGDRETRIVQEMLLGIGGVRLLRKLGVEPHVFHLNEGHSAFLTLELARELIQSQGLTFAAAAARVKQQAVFTTHTPVAAGNDEFDVDLLTRAVGHAYQEELGLDHEEFLALGRINSSNPREAFGLTPLAIRMCRSTNGVSRKHGEVSRALWQKLTGEADVNRVPITHITNGVHAPTWASPLIRSLFETHVGSDWSRQLLHRAQWEEGIARISDGELWVAHSLMKARLVAFIRQRSFEARATRGDSLDHTAAAKQIFEPEVLTIGFARRVAGYKRWNLLLKDPVRLRQIINHAQRPVQFVFAGKAHPQDGEAKLVLQEVAKWKYDLRVRDRAVFIEDYDHQIARQLVQSVDVWLNVPRRPLEASGTSGEKVAINGGLNLSILDGWWLEGYDGTNGFAVGDAGDGDTPQTITAAGNPEADAGDAESLYHLLENEVAPLYYDRDAHGLPRKWIAMMKRSIATLGPEFNSDRMVEEYAHRIYS